MVVAFGLKESKKEPVPPQGQIGPDVPKELLELFRQGLGTLPSEKDKGPYQGDRGPMDILRDPYGNAQEIG